MIAMPHRGLYVITDSEQVDFTSLLAKTEIALMSGAVMLQYRNKNRNDPDKFRQASTLQSLCKQYHVPFIINDDVELARELDADGVHLGKEDISCKKARIMLGPDKIIGLSCYNLLETAIDAISQGATYVAFGAFFPTSTKTGTVKTGLLLLHEAKKRLNLPIVAIGGITPENGRALVEAGADYLAVISGIYGVADTAQAVHSYISLFKTH